MLIFRILTYLLFICLFGSSNSLIVFFRFPKSNEKLRKEWIRRCRRADPINVNHSRVCSAHFTPEDFERNYKAELLGAPGRRYLKPNAIPTLHLKPDEYYNEAPLAQTRKRKLTSAAKNEKDTPAASHSKVIAKSKRTRRVGEKSYMTEEIVFEVEEPLSFQDDDLHGGDSDDQSADVEQLGRRKPEKGVFECSTDLIDDVDDISLVKNEIRIPAESSLKDDPTSDCCKVINPNEQPSKLPDSQEEMLKQECDACEDDNAQKSLTDCARAAHETEYKDGSAESEFQPCKADLTPTLAITNVTTVLSFVSEPQKVAKARNLELFTPNQLASLVKTKKRVRWTDEEILEAIKLRLYSLPMYIYLRKEKGYPFPGKLAISRWAKNIKLRGGILQNVLKMMQLGGRHLSTNKNHEINDFCVLSLGEMDVKETIEYDEVQDKVIGPFKKMQVMMASSLTGSWRQPVFVDFDCKITKDTVMETIADLFNVGYHVVCFSSDCSDESVSLWSDLVASTHRPCFPHPIQDGLVVVVPDAQHAICLLRNNLLDSGFQIEGCSVNRAPLDALLKMGVCSKLKPRHLGFDYSDKRRVDLAVQLISSTVGSALNTYKPGDPEVATSTGNFLKVMNHWFDLMNVGTSELTVPFRSAYGHKRLDQDKLLNHVKSVISCMTSKDSSFLPFQTGIIMSCNSLPLLYDEMNKKSNSQYIMTQWLNHTGLNSLFSLLTLKYSDIPSPSIALDRLRSNLFGDNVDTPPESLFTFVARRAQIAGNTGHLDAFKSIAPHLPDTIFSSPEFITDNKLSHHSLSVIAELINSGLNHKYPQLCRCANLTGLNGNSTGHQPTSFFLGNLVKMENFFGLFTRSRFISECEHVLLRLTRTMRGFSNPLPVEVIKIFVRLRIEIYLRSLVLELPPTCD